MSEHPWRDIQKPLGKGEISARRVDAQARWEFFWARDSDGSPMLILHFASASEPKNRLPKLRGVELFQHNSASTSDRSLALRLRDLPLIDLFERFCIDVVSCAETASTEAEAVALTVARTWRWHHLMRGDRGTLLSEAEQKGLLGELLILEATMLPALGAVQALEAWRGPLGEAHDFSHGGVSVESKVHGGGVAPAIHVSSEFQLEEPRNGTLYLQLSLLEPTDEEGFSLSDVASRIRDRLVLSSRAVIGRYDALLNAGGFRREDDYSAFRWTGGLTAAYCVSEGFPRLIPGNVPAGVETLRYCIAISALGPFVSEIDAIEQSLKGEPSVR